MQNKDPIKGVFVSFGPDNLKAVITKELVGMRMVK